MRIAPSRHDLILCLTALLLVGTMGAQAAARKVAATEVEVAALVAQAGASFEAGRDDKAITMAKRVAMLGQPALEGLLPLLDSKSIRQRRFAAFAIAKIGQPAAAAAPQLIALLKDEAPLVRRNAAEALGRMGAVASCQALRSALSDKDVDVALAAAASLRELAEDDDAARAAIAKFEARLVKSNVSIAETSPGTEGSPEDYLVGGPLAGIKLKRMPTEYGEPEGYPGAIPELASKAVAEAKKQNASFDDYDPLKAPYTTVGNYPEYELYDGSVEHWRAYMLKYMDVRSLFDRQSQLRNWVAPYIPGAGKAQQDTYAAPIYWVPRWGGSVLTDRKAKPASVVRAKPGGIPFTLDCGELQQGVYAIRVIAAVPTEKLKFMRDPLIMRMTVDDGVNGEVSTYRKRCGYVDEFYSMAEFYFHAPTTRAYKATVSVDLVSKVEILVHNISLDDALSGATRRASKTQVNLKRNKARVAKVMAARKAAKSRKGGDFLAEERILRDSWLWRSFPRDNLQGYKIYRPDPRLKLGANTPGDFGVWSSPCIAHFSKPTPADTDVFLQNRAMGLNYTFSDLAANKPLPVPYPFPDDGTGLIWADNDEGTGGRFFGPIATVVNQYYWNYPTAAVDAVKKWETTGDDQYARDAAVALIRWAYALPALDTESSYLSGNILHIGTCGREERFRKRGTNSNFYRWYTDYATYEMDAYEVLFPYIHDNWELARSISRFVPWVKTPQDIIKLIDVYLVQETAQRILRYHWQTGEMKPATLASVLGDKELTTPWMDFLFKRTFVYPMPLAGLDDLMVSGTTREGTEYVASSYYAGGENAIDKAADLISYLEAGGDVRFDLSDPKRYPKPLAACYWMFERMVVGANNIRIGDVTGPEKAYGALWENLSDASYWGWRWSQDPRFAFILAHYAGRHDFSDAEWTDIQTAATTVKRAPWLDLPSRALPNWATILETGRQHEDNRFRTAVALRTGLGWGHHHNDALDLQVFAHGTMATCDGGQRPSYSIPGDRTTYMHNLVEVNGGIAGKSGAWLGYSWAKTLSDASGARYALHEATPPKNHADVNRYTRQTALIDVDNGTGAEPLAPEFCKPGAILPKGVTTPNAYVFDVVRVSGGERHTYCFHGNRTDEVTHNIVTPVAMDKATPKDQSYTGSLAGEKLAGDAPAHLVITFRAEEQQAMRDLGKNYDPTAGRNFTRLHVIGQKGARVLRGSLNCTQYKYLIPMVFVQRRGALEDDSATPSNLESAFAAVVEPYVKQPFITEINALTVQENETDSTRAVALSVKTTNGHHDICFADGRPEKVRVIREPSAEIRVAGAFAYVSTDADGLRQASLTGGTLLKSDDVLLQPAVGEYRGQITQTAYGDKTFQMDGDWPSIDGTQRAFTFEVGVPGRMTVYTATQVKRRRKGATVTVQRGADYYLSSVNDVDEEKNIVYCSLTAGTGNEGYEPTPGIDKHWVASNADATKFWRADYQAGDRSTGRIAFQLDGPVSQADLSGGKFRLWEYGVGDTVRHSTFSSLKRFEGGEWLLETDVDVTVGLKCEGMESSVDGKKWRRVRTRKAGDLTLATIRAEDVSPDGSVRLRLR